MAKEKAKQEKETKQELKPEEKSEQKQEIGKGSIGTVGSDAAATCTDKKCPIHGNLKTRGRSFKGYVVRINNKRAVIEFERFVYMQKYERYEKRKTRIHAHLPDCMASKIKIGDYVSVAECRPLSKMIHHVLISDEGRNIKEEIK
jgi:small subunit ribosomal protein S17